MGNRERGTENVSIESRLRQANGFQVTRHLPHMDVLMPRRQDAESGRHPSLGSTTAFAIFIASWVFRFV
jgi:hypothetical protein